MSLYCPLLFLLILPTMGWQFTNECSWSSLLMQPNTQFNLFLCSFWKFILESWHFDLNLYKSCLFWLLNFCAIRYGWIWNFLYVISLSFEWVSLTDRKYLKAAWFIKYLILILYSLVLNKFHLHSYLGQWTGSNFF